MRHAHQHGMTMVASHAQVQPLGPRTRSQTPRVVLAEPDPLIRGWLRPALERDVGLEVVEATGADTMETEALERDGVQLVVTNAKLGRESALQSLAKVRAAGCRTPFIVYTSFQDSLMRVLVSDVEGTVLSSRIVDLDNFSQLASALSRNASETTEAH